MRVRSMGAAAGHWMDRPPAGRTRRRTYWTARLSKMVAARPARDVATVRHRVPIRTRTAPTAERAATSARQTAHAKAADAAGVRVPRRDVGVRASTRALIRRTVARAAPSAVRPRSARTAPVALLALRVSPTANTRASTWRAIRATAAPAVARARRVASARAARAHARAGRCLARAKGHASTSARIHGTAATAVLRAPRAPSARVADAHRNAAPGSRHAVSLAST
jgi:hypothetical protein